MMARVDKETPEGDYRSIPLKLETYVRLEELRRIYAKDAQYETDDYYGVDITHDLIIQQWLDHHDSMIESK